MHHSYFFFFFQKRLTWIIAPLMWKFWSIFFRRQFVCKLFTFLTSHEPLLQNHIVVLLQFSEFQLILAQSIIRWREFKFYFQMKGHLIFSGEIIIRLQKHSTNFNQTWHKSFLGERNSSLYKVKGHTYIQGEIIAKILWQNLKIFFPKANMNQTWYKASLYEGDSRSLKWSQG